MRRRIEKGCFGSERTQSIRESVPMAMPEDVPAVVDMATDMDIEVLLEKQVCMLMITLGQTETCVAAICGLGRFTVVRDVLTCGPALPWISVLGMISTRKLTV